MTDDDDDGWVAGLAGRSGDGRDEARIGAAREGRLMREALLRWPPSIDAVRDGDPEHLAALVARARAEGLFEGRTSDVVERPVGRKRVGGRLRAWWADARSPRRGGRWATAVVVVAVVVTTGYLNRPPSSDRVEDAVRAGPDAVTVLRARDPAASRTELVEALARHGIRASTYSRFGRLGVDADLPTPLPPDVREELSRRGIPPPGDGVLRVEIEPAAR